MATHEEYEDDETFDGGDGGGGGASVSGSAALVTKRDGFGGTELSQRHETATSAVAARQAALVQARFVMALQRPRVIEDVSAKLRKECERPSFAKVARYAKPQGWVVDEKGQYVKGPDGQRIRNYVRGWSIEFVKRALQIMGNVEPEITTLFDDDRKRIIRVAVTDFETNTSWAREITIEKTVERKQLKNNRGKTIAPIGSRENTYGDTVYLYPATDEELRMKEDRLISIYARNMGIKLIPGDILDDCLETIAKTQASEVKSDPDKARKDLIAKFYELGVKASDLMEYLGGQTLETLSPDQILELRAIGVLRKEGVPWREILASSPYRESDEDDGDDEPKDKPNELRDRVRGIVDKGKAAQERTTTVIEMARVIGVKAAQVDAVIKLVGSGRNSVHVARYEKEATGNLDEVLVGEIVSRARKVGLLPPEASAAPPAERKGSEPPTAAPTSPQAAPAGVDGAQGAPAAERAPAARQRRAAGAGKDAQARRAAIAEQEGVTADLVAAVEELAGGGDDDVAISAALKVKGFSADPPTVAAVLSALKK
jgi:hypothetical protein